MSLQTPTTIRSRPNKLYGKAKATPIGRRRGPAVKSVGKPDALIGHVRFDERGRETERLAKPQAAAPFLDSTIFPVLSSRPRMRFFSETIVSKRFYLGQARLKKGCRFSFFPINRERPARGRALRNREGSDAAPPARFARALSHFGSASARNTGSTGAGRRLTSGGPPGRSDDQRLRTVQDRRRTVLLAYGRPDESRRRFRRRAGREGRDRARRDGRSQAVRFARLHRQGPRDRQGRHPRPQRPDPGYGRSRRRRRACRRGPGDEAPAPRRHAQPFL